MMDIVNLLATDEPLPNRAFDHPLTGAWSDRRDCHIRPNLVLICRKPDDASLELVPIASSVCDPPVRAGCDRRAGRGRRGAMLSTMLASPRMFADDTTLPVLDPGQGKTKPEGRYLAWDWVIQGRDRNRPWLPRPGMR